MVEDKIRNFILDICKTYLGIAFLLFFFMEIIEFGIFDLMNNLQISKRVKSKLETFTFLSTDCVQGVIE